MSTTLTAGDIAIVGFNFINSSNASPPTQDDFSFILLEDVTVGTAIKFTDNGWQADNSFRDNEGTLTWTAASNLTAGTVIQVSITSGGGNPSFSGNGDQILAYHGDEASPTFIYALNNSGDAWQTTGNVTAATSYIPQDLSNGTTAIALVYSANNRNAYYDSTKTGAITSGTKEELLAAISNKDNWTGDRDRVDLSTVVPASFTINSGSPDTTAPTANTFTPGDEATNVAVADNLSVTFSENIKEGTGNILLKDAGGTTIETFDVATATNLTVTGSTLTIDPTSDLASSTGYYVEIANGAILDLADNAYAGLSGAAAWNFTTADVAPPTIVTLTPGDDTNNVGVGDILSIQFNENIQKGAGNLVIKKASDDSVVETISVANAAVSGNTLTVDPGSNLELATDYYVEIDTGAIEDISGNDFSGIADNATWNFTTTATVTDPGGGSTGGGSTDDGSTDAGSTDAGSTDAGSTDDGSTDNPPTDNIDSGSASGGSTDNISNSGVNLGSRPSNNSGTSIVVRNVVSNTEHTLPEPNLTVDILLGGDTDDFLPGTADANDLSGFGGQDTLVGFAANDNLAGNDGDDLMFGNQGTDYMDGGNGRDTMFGGQGEDALQGGDNADILVGDIGQDCLHGDDGNDVIFGNTGNDSISGGLGDDIVFAGQDDDFVEGNENNDILLGDVGNDNLNGDSGNDILFGNLGNDRLDGGDGDDRMFGGQDNDTLIGNTGGDVLSGNVGNDSLIGGAGGDRFDFRSGDGNDIIADFTDGQDIIGLADGLTFEQLAISQVGNDTQITATGLSITLQGVSLNTIDSTDFALV